MELAEAAHQEALYELHPAPPEPPRPTFLGDPCLGAPAISSSTTFGQLFTQLARCVRQSILLEARIAAGDHATLPPPPANRAHAEPPPPANPQSHRAAPDDRTRIRPERLDDDMAALSGRPVAEILGGIAATLGAAEQPARAKPRHRPPPPPRPLSQAERAALLYQQQRGIPPPG